jgi:hypothetical protein
VNDRQLVRIQHIRCADWGEEGTYILAPTEWTDDEIQKRVDAAQTAYLKDFEAAKVHPDRPAYPHLDYKKVDPALTVGEVQARHDEQVAAYKAWQDQDHALSRTFEDYLAVEGFSRLWEGGTEVTADWGHNHGAGYQYGDEYPNKGDLPSPLKAATGHGDDDQ